MTANEPVIVELTETSTAEIAATVPMVEIGRFFDGAFSRLPVEIAKRFGAPAGPPYA